MAQEIKQASLFGRIGSGIGQGLAEQLPKEIEQGRLSSGLNKLAKQKGLNPMEAFAQLASIPGAAKNPQLLQTAGDLYRQQAYLDSLKNQYEGGGPNGGKGGYQPSQEEFNQPLKGEIPTLATPEDTAQSYKEYIPPTEQEERKDAFDNFQKNPARYNYNFDQALQERKAITSRNQEIQKAHQGSEATATGKEEKVKGSLDKEIQRLGIRTTGEKPNFDPKLLQLFEQKALNAVLSKKDGGEGLSQEQATKTYSDQLLKAYQNYTDLSTLSPWSPKDFNRRFDAVVKNFEPFGIEGKNIIMNKAIADYGVAPIYAGHKTFPINKGEVPTSHKKGVMNDASYSQLKKEMGNKHSPLSIAYELQKNGHDPRSWLNYLNKNRDHLEVWQADQLTKNINLWDLKDMWLSAFEEEKR